MEKLFETKRLEVRQFTAGDAADLYEICRDPDLVKFMPFPQYKSIDDAHARLRVVVAKYADPAPTRTTSEDKIDYAIVLKSENKVIGSLGYSRYTSRAGGIAELGYYMSPKYQGNGYMTEAVVGLFKYIKSHKIAMRIEAKHDVANVASGRVMQKAGMNFEGIMRKYTGNNTCDRVDAAMYSILYEEI